MLFNGHVTHSSAPGAGEDNVLALTDSLVQVLPRRYGFNLRTHRPILPDGTDVAAPAVPTTGGSRTAELGIGE